MYFNFLLEIGGDREGGRQSRLLLGFIKSWAPGKFVDCEDNFDHLEEGFLLTMFSSQVLPTCENQCSFCGKHLIKCFNIHVDDHNSVLISLSRMLIIHHV